MIYVETFQPNEKSSGAGCCNQKSIIVQVPELAITFVMMLEKSPGWWCSHDGAKFVCDEKIARHHQPVLLSACRRKRKVLVANMPNQGGRDIHSVAAQRPWKGRNFETAFSER